MCAPALSCFSPDLIVRNGKIPEQNQTIFEIEWKNIVAKRCAYRFLAPSEDRDIPLFEEVVQDFSWTSGRSMVAKRQQIKSLHAALAERFPLDSILEISTKSPNQIGVLLSAFNLRLPGAHGGIPLESAYQAAKVFRISGSDAVLHLKHLELEGPHEAKRAAAEFRREDLLHFRYEGEVWPAHVHSLFYDYLFWIGVNASESLLAKLSTYECFTDIEFNKTKSGFQAGKSFNTQARSAAIARRIAEEHPFAATKQATFEWFYTSSQIESISPSVLF
jgi:type I restriction enzyme M protein